MSTGECLKDLLQLLLNDGIFSRETSGCGLILLVIGKPSDFGPPRYTLAATGVVCPFAESGNPLNPISRLALNPSISRRFKEYFRGRHARAMCGCGGPCVKRRGL